MCRQNKNGDFIFHVDFIDGKGNVAAVPENVTIELSTEFGQETFTATVSKEKSSGCKRSGDGLDIFVPLSRHPIGTGRMIAKIIRQLAAEDFPDGIQRLCEKVTTNVLLWDGNSDGATTIKGNVVLAE